MAARRVAPTLDARRNGGASGTRMVARCVWHRGAGVAAPRIAHKSKNAVGVSAVSGRQPRARRESTVNISKAAFLGHVAHRVDAGISVAGQKAYPGDVAPWCICK